MRTREAQARAHRGAKLLDKYYLSPSWARRVNLNTLDMGDFFECVLGQLFKTYPLGTNALQIIAHDNEARGHGFATPFGPRNDRDYAQLTTAWTREIAQRLPTTPAEGS